jgi:AcrR family transcriptional regulator
VALQVNFRRHPEQADGLRSRKKLKTRRAIEDAAIALFTEQGYDATTVEQIAERAEISATTFFRYFPNKADVILCQQDAQLPLLQQTIIERPASEDDLTAIRRAIQIVWAPSIDPDRTRRSGYIITDSPVLRGFQDDITREWVHALTEALAKRNGASIEDWRCPLAARVAIAIFNSAIEAWVANACRDDLVQAIDRTFNATARLAAQSLTIAGSA